MVTTQADQAHLLRSLHKPGDPLVLPNAWDAMSARIVATAGARAVATTSAGVAWSLGAPDGGRLSRREAIAALSRITAAVDVPVTADLEHGFADDPAGVADTVHAAIAAGAVGVNIEDSLRPIPDQMARLSAARRAADATSVHLFLNARIDTHRASVAPGSWLSETLNRARAYAEAGADGILVLGNLTLEQVDALASRQPLALNVAVGPGTLTVAQLAGAGAARISAGSSLAEAAYRTVDRAARDLLTQGHSAVLDDRLTWSHLNSLSPSTPSEEFSATS